MDTSNKFSTQVDEERRRNVMRTNSTELLEGQSESDTYEGTGTSGGSSSIESNQRKTKDLNVQKGTRRFGERTRGWSQDESFEEDQRKNKGRESGLRTAYDWSATDSGNWNMQKSMKVSLEVPPGIRTKLYQVVGSCSFYRVRTSAFKRVDVRMRVDTELNHCHTESVYFETKNRECRMQGQEHVEQRE
jgi:hypothetical protein